MPAKSDVVRYAEKHPEITTLLENGKLHFTQTGQDFPANTTTKVLEAYAQGKAYRRAIHARENEGYDFSQHEPYIVGHKHKDEKHFLYCTVTKSTLPRMKSVVEGHVKGKKFQRRMAEVQKEKERQEKVKEKRRLARERARKRKEEEDKMGDREVEDGEKEGDDMKENEEGEEDDVLDGIISADNVESGDEGDDDEDGAGKDGQGTGAADEDVEMGEADSGERIEEDEKEEEGNVFWTRGSRRVAMHDDSDDDDDDDEWGSATSKKASARPKAGTLKSAAQAEMKPADEPKAPESGTKRKLAERKVTKKRRRPRQKRKTEEPSLL